MPFKLVYAAHNYGHVGPTLNGTKYGEMAWSEFRAIMEQEWGYVVTENQAYTAPVWVSEFGVGFDVSSDPWFDNIVRYLAEKDFDWAFWAVNPGPKPSGDGETYSMLAPDWKTPLTDWRVDLLKGILSPVKGPGVEPGFESNPNNHFAVLLFSDWDTNHSKTIADWAPGSYKATCADPMRLVGMGVGERAGIPFSHSVLCSDYGGFSEPLAWAFVSNDNLDSTHYRTHTGDDWAPSYNKLECGVDEYIAGLSQVSSVLDYNLHGVLCAKSKKTLGTDCHGVVFDSGDDRATEYPGDWDPYHTKGQCALDEYVAGVSAKNGTPHSLLCCR